MRQAWGKTGRENEEDIHPLVHHCMDVAAVFVRMVELPVIRDRLETAASTPLTDLTRQRFTVLVFYMTLGSCTRIFRPKAGRPNYGVGRHADTSKKAGLS